MRFINRVSQILLFLSTSAGIAMTAFVSLSAIMRYVVGKPFGFTEEFVGLLFSALVFLVFPYITIAKQHISITLITDLYSPIFKKIADVLSNILITMFSLWFVYFAYDFCMLSYDLNSKSDLAGITLWPWMSLMIISFILVALIGLLFIKKGHLPTDSYKQELK